MKKTLLLFITVSGYFFSHGQAVPNGDFENWETESLNFPGESTPRTYEVPTGWNTFNLASALGFETSAQKVTDAASGSYAVKISNIESMDRAGKDTIEGVITQVFPASGNPKYFYGLYKSDLPSGEQGQVVVLGKRKAAAESEVLLGYTPLLNDAATYTPFLITLLQPSVPVDSFGIIISSFNSIGNQQTKYTIGAYVQVDNVGFSDVVTSELKDLLEASVYVSPNPSSGLVTVSNTYGSVQHIEVVSAAGESIYSSKTSQGQQVVDLSGHPKGLYILHATSEGQRYSKKIVIQ